MFWNLAASGEELALHLHGVIDGALLDEPSVSTSNLIAEIRASKAKKITVRINSKGGSLFGGIALYNALQSHPASVVAVVEGLAASAASIVAMGGRTVMQRGTQMMIHSPWALAAGDARDLRRIADVLDKARDGLIDIYQAKTRKSADELRQMLDAETWMSADEAKRHRFADEIAAPAVQNMISRVAPAELARLHEDAAITKAVRFIAGAANTRRPW
jgi:ATP-dependent Clp protease protease subunit